MHIARDSEFSQRRTELQFNTLPENVRAYIFDLELDNERCHRKIRRMRKNIKSMQPKLQIENLKGALQTAGITHVYHGLTETDVVRIVQNMAHASGKAKAV